MDDHSSWLHHPAQAYGQWQGTVAAGAPRPELVVPKHGPRQERRIPLPAFALAPLALYHSSLPSPQAADTPLFPMPIAGKAMSDMMLIKIVKAALDGIDFHAPDMSPCVLCNTYARRLLLAGRTNEEVSRLLGLVSQRTVVRLRATMPPAQQGAPNEHA